MVWRSYDDWNDKEVWLVWVLSMPRPKPTSKVEFNAVICDTTLAVLPKIDEDEDGFANGQIKKTKWFLPLFHPSFCSCSQTGSYVKEKKFLLLFLLFRGWTAPKLYRGTQLLVCDYFMTRKYFYQHPWIRAFMGMAAYNCILLYSEFYCMRHYSPYPYPCEMCPFSFCFTIENETRNANTNSSATSFI